MYIMCMAYIVNQELKEEDMLLAAIYGVGNCLLTVLWTDRMLCGHGSAITRIRFQRLL